MKLHSKTVLLSTILLISSILPAQTVQWNRFDSSDLAYNKNDLTTLFPDKVIGYKIASNGDIIALHMIKGNVNFGGTTYNITSKWAIIKVIYDKQMNLKSSAKILVDVGVRNFELDEKDNLYIYGTYLGVAYFTSSDSIKSINPNSFIAKFSPTNVFRWVRTVNNDQNYIDVTKMSILKGKIYLLGYLYSGRFIYNNTQIYNWNFSYHVDYILSIDTSGGFRFVNRIKVSNQSLFVTILDFDIDTIVILPIYCTKGHQN